MAWGYPSWGGGRTDTTRVKGKKKKRPKESGFGSTGFGHDTGSGIGTNRNKGNERFGKTYTEEKAKGGVWHVYGKNDRVFVPGKTAKKEGKPMRGKSEAVSMIVDAMRGGPIRGKGGLPKPGDKGRRTLPVAPGARGQQVGTVNNPTEVAGSKPYARDRKRAIERAKARKMRARDRDRARVNKR